MSFFKDAIAVFKKKDLLFLESYKESADVYSFLFEKENGITWETGQHGLFSISHEKIKNPTKPFTIASAPMENVIRITTRISDNPSDFKKAMLEFKQGMKIRMSGPVGSFNMKDNNPSLFIAGGIGITPFRSMLKQLDAEESGDEKQINLLYLDSNHSYIFKDELDGIANNTSISVTYLDSRDGLHQEIDNFTTIHKNNGKSFIAGPQQMVDSISSYLQNNNISKRNINKDVFYGY